MKPLCAPPRKRIRGLIKILQSFFVVSGVLILFTSVAIAAGIGPYPAGIVNKAVGDQFKITDFNSVLDVTRRMFVDENGAGVADDIVGVGVFTDPVGGFCPAGTQHLDIDNSGATIDNGECFQGLNIVDGAVGLGTDAPSTGGEQNLILDVEGALGAQYFCDADGNNCSTALEIGSELWQETTNVISPVNTSETDIMIENAVNQPIGFIAKNTNDIDNYTGARAEFKGSGADYTNTLYVGKYGAGYYVPSWAGNAVVATDKKLALMSGDEIVFQGGTFAVPTDIMSVNSSGLAFTSGVRVNSILDEDDLVSDSDTALATQQSIKAYIDTAVTSVSGDKLSDGGVDGVNVVNNAGAITMNILGGMSIKRTTVSDANYTLLGDDNLVAVTALTADRTITLPNVLCTDGRIFTIKDESGQATGTVAIVLDPEGATTIDGGPVHRMESGYNSIEVYCGGSNWFIK